MDACAGRRSFLKALTTTTAALAVGACGGVKVGDTGTGTTPPVVPTGNLAPVWVTVPTITFTQGIASSISIAAYVSDPNNDALTITKIAGTLPQGVTYNAGQKRFEYDGAGPVGSTGGHQLQADDGKP